MTLHPAETTPSAPPVCDGASPRPRVLVAEPIADSGLALLRAHAEVEVLATLDAAALRAALARAEALIVRSQTLVSGELLDAAPRLKVVARAGAGHHLRVHGHRRGEQEKGGGEPHSVSSAPLGRRRTGVAPG